MNFWDRLTRFVGALPAGRVVWGVALVFSAWAVADLYLLRISSGLSQSTYDTMVRARFHAAPVDPRVVIVDIDESSLSRMADEFGRWPWPRDTLATVLDYIERQKPQAVAWDVVFSDADRLSPGGDKAFDEAAKRSPHSHFSVVRLPPENDSQSKIGRLNLPGLWLTGPATTPASTLALIPPVLPSVAASRLGYNNGYPDGDGVLRRYRYTERLADGSTIQSIALSVARHIPPGPQAATEFIATDDQLAWTSGQFSPEPTLIAWRKRANSYPRVSFADVFAAAEGGKPRQPVPAFAGKVVLIGATASSLHDIHPTPLSPTQAGVDSLATAIDNAINRRHVNELPRGAQAGIAVVMCLAMAAFVRRRGLDSLNLALLPVALLGVSYLTLHGSPMFLDLNLSAGIALVMLTVLRSWNGWRRNYWCDAPDPAAPLHIMALECSGPVSFDVLDSVIDALAEHAPSCRVLGGDATSTAWPYELRWPEVARFTAIAGPLAELEGLKAVLEAPVLRSGTPQALPPDCGRMEMARRALLAYHSLITKATDGESP